jgi:glycosyltransferase involved in cell wall biosynthesis
LKTVVLRYGRYRENQYHALLKKTKAMIYLSEHETQGLARLQANSCDLPVLAWDQEGFWEDPSYFPHIVRFGPVSSVPHWDERCGVKFKNMEEFPAKLEEFLTLLSRGHFKPREFVEERFTLEHGARRYMALVHTVQESLNA